MGLVFISHSSDDATLLEQELIPRLKARGITVWYSPEAIQTADQWEHAIRKGLEASDWMLVALSPRAAKSPWVRAELNWALTNRVGRVVPIMIDSVDPSQVHMLLWDLQYVDFRRPDDASVQRIVSTISTARAEPTASGESQEAEHGNAQAEQASPLLAMALVHLQQSRYSDAVADASSAIEIAPRHAGAHFVRGLAHLGGGDASRAIADFGVALETDPAPALKPMIHVKRARAYDLINDDRRAIDDCNEALKYDPSSTEALLTRAVLRRRMLEPARALKDLEDLISLDPKSVEGRLQLAQVYRELRRLDDARVQYAAAVSLDPSVSSRIPAHLPGEPTGQGARVEEALQNIKPLADLARMDHLPAPAKSRVLAELMRIGFPKMTSEVKFLLANLPKDRAEYKAVSAMADALRSIGQM